MYIALSHTEFEEALDNMPLLVATIDKEQFIKAV